MGRFGSSTFTFITTRFTHLSPYIGTLLLNNLFLMVVWKFGYLGCVGYLSVGLDLIITCGWTTYEVSVRGS